MVNFAKRLFKGDKILLIMVIALMFISLLVIFSSTGRLAYNEQGGNTWHYVLRQLMLCASGLVIMWGMKFFSWRWLYQNVGILLLVAAALVGLAAFGGQNINGAGRWIRIPLIGITFQPSEIAKIAIVLYSAKLLSDFQEERGCSSQVLKYFWAPVVVIGLIFLDNFSTSALVAVVCLVMCWVARVRWQLLAKTLGVLFGTLLVLILLGLAFPKIQEAGRIGTIIGRVTSFVVKDDDTEEGKNYNYQSDQAHIAVAKGGILGCGPGNSTQRNFLPHPYSDFIYAIIIEEYPADYEGGACGQSSRPAGDISGIDGLWIGIYHCLAGDIPHGGECGFVSGDRTNFAISQHGRYVLMVYLCIFGNYFEYSL